VRRTTATLSLGLFLGMALLGGLTACGGAKDKADAGKADAGDKLEQAPTDSGKAPEAESPTVDEVHFDISKDKSGILARTASTLETTDRLTTDSPVRSHLAELSHHAEAGPSNEKLCAHIAEIRGDEAGPAEACAIILEHERMLLGPEVFSQMADCITAATSDAALAACEAAEKEAERLLHVNKHGDDLSEEVCTNLFEHFEKLAMDDAGEHAEIVKDILEEVRADMLVACQDHGTQAEVDCAMAATTLEALGACTTLM
jgi:hypothetical protein